MPTLTLELPDDFYQKLNNIPEAERNDFAVGLLRDGVTSAPNDFTPDYANEDDFNEASQKIRVGFAEFESGQSLSLEEARAQSLACFTSTVNHSMLNMLGYSNPIVCCST